MPHENKLFEISSDYFPLLASIKNKVREARLKAAVAVNEELISLYWHIGKKILERETWGSGFLHRLSKDLQHAFPETRGFSVRNLQRMRQFANQYPEFENTPQAVAHLPWGHVCLLIYKIKDLKIRGWYAQQSIEHSWSRTILERNLSNQLYERQANPSHKASNYLTRLSEPQSSLAQELLKQPYNFDFLGLHDDAYEREIEHASIQHITKFMLELGKGFAFVGSQVPITIENEEFFIDMLFYSLHLRCFTVVEFKATKFRPEHVGQLNFYLSAVDDLMRHEQDNPSIGLLLCKSRNKVVAEYSLRNVEKPIGISEFELTRAIPDELKNNLPSIEQIEAELNVCSDGEQV